MLVHCFVLVARLSFNPPWNDNIPDRDAPCTGDTSLAKPPQRPRLPFPYFKKLCSNLGWFSNISSLGPYPTLRKRNHFSSVFTSIYFPSSIILAGCQDSSVATHLQGVVLGFCKRSDVVLLIIKEIPEAKKSVHLHMFDMFWVSSSLFVFKVKIKKNGGEGHAASL